MNALEEFKEFISKANVVDLAVAVVIGGALNLMIQAFVADIITPAIGVPGHMNLTGVKFVLNGSTFMPGAFFNTVLSFIIIAAVVFFLIVKPVRKLQERAKKKVEPNTKLCPECLSTIPLKATRCAFCTAKIGNRKG